MDKLLPWFALKSIVGIGNHTFKRLIVHFKSPDKIFQASTADILQVEGVTRRQATAIKTQKISEDVKKELDLVKKKHYEIVTFSDSDYPVLLREIPDPPPFLYVYGHIVSDSKNIAVVGSRNATGYGIASTRRLCEHLANLKITIVSGMAKGIDTAAHEGALMGKGKTVAVLGSGLEKIYPSENRRLFHQISKQGAVISEFPLLTEPEGPNFPRRNRIISGMSLGAVIVEATKKSGSLITARLAAEQGREVFAVPGSIQSFKSTGTHGLIKQGAKLVEHARDIIQELTPFIDTRVAIDPDEQGNQNSPPAGLSPEAARVFQALEPYPVHIDDLVYKVSMEPGKLLSVLLELELKGMVHQAPGKLFSTAEK
jgi:DNA processing protein